VATVDRVSVSIVFETRATRFGLDQFIDGNALVELLGEDFAWQHGWEYLLDERVRPAR
jgi:hypothetical protein